MIGNVQETGETNHLIALSNKGIYFIGIVLFLTTYSFPTYSTDCSKENTNADVITCFQNKLQEFKGIPKGAVLAFNLSSCPSGWKPLISAKGRVVIGSGRGDNLSARILGDIGGTETHRLTIEEMPIHKHKIAGGTEYEGIESGHTKSFNTANQWQGESEPSGNGYPHNNMPPFIVMQYCEKE